MMKTVHCHDCDCIISNEEIALNLKLLGKHIGKLSCYACLSKALGMKEEKLMNMVDFFITSGCILFQKRYTD